MALASTVHPADPGCYVKTSGSKPSGGHFTINFTRVCGDPVRAYVKRKYLGITQDEVGNTIGANATGSSSLNYDGTVVDYGYQDQYDGLHWTDNSTKG